MSGYLIVSTAVIDDITLADGRHMGRFPGGAGLYAACGAAMWNPSCEILTGIGEDWPFFPWFRRNRLSTDGLMVKDKRTALSRIKYFPDGEREETPVLGPSHYKRLEATSQEVAAKASCAEGVYIFKEADKGYWDGILAARDACGFKLCWEINAVSCRLEKLETVKGIARSCDIFSINLSEAVRLTGVYDENELLEVFSGFGAGLVYLRAGEKGAYLVTADNVVTALSQKDVKVVDPTGAGNSSTGAVLVGFSEGCGLEEIGLMGSLSAARCIEQFGPVSDLREARERNKECMRVRE